MVLCTDDRALRHLQDELQDETLSLTAPTARQQPGLTQALVEVANVGGSHIRLMLKDPANYHVDKSIVQMSLRAFYTILWNPANEMHNRVHSRSLSATWTRSPRGGPSSRTSSRTTSGTTCRSTSTRRRCTSGSTGMGWRRWSSQAAVWRRTCPFTRSHSREPCGCVSSPGLGCPQLC